MWESQWENLSLREFEICSVVGGYNDVANAISVSINGALIFKYSFYFEALNSNMPGFFWH